MDDQELSPAILNVREVDDDFDGAVMHVRVVGGGGEGGTSNYNELSNKPKINSITLTGNKSGHDLGLMNEPTVVTLTGSTVSISQVEKNKIYVCEDAVTNLTVTDVEDSYIESAIYFCSGDTIHVEIDGVDVIGTTTFKPNKYYIVALVNKTMIVGEKQ